ncbi:glycosyltransferase [Aquabacterium soli]|uniref:Glycosyltransferase n=1 Tax=Aquabacterium soli TaxID=2493092 RepID=A0A426VB68_9BURK|nr:glycosyltransferase [Aquabacterium soli]
MRILWAMPYLPWPVTSGGKSRQFHLLRSMAERGHRITLLVQSKTALDDEARARLAPMVERLIVLPRRSLKHPVTLWHAALAPWPLLTTVNGHAPALSARFNELLSEGGWDVVQIEHSYGFQPFELALARHRQPFVLCEHNVESQLGAATYSKWPVWLRPLARYDQWRARRWERRVLSQASAVAAVTDADARTMERLSGGQPVGVVANGVDTRAFSQVEPAVGSDKVLFVGNYEYAPNVDAIEWALTEVFPRLWRQRPGARFIVCGHAMPEAWRHRFTDARIEWRGYVPHLAEVQAEAAAFLAPLRFGGGSKLKVLEALAAGLPLVSTPEGVSGLGVVDGVHAHLGGTADGLAEALAAVMGQPDRARALGEAGREHVAARFDWSASVAQLESLYERLPAPSLISPWGAGISPLASHEEVA